MILDTVQRRPEPAETFLDLLISKKLCIYLHHFPNADNDTCESLWIGSVPCYPRNKTVPLANCLQRQSAYVMVTRLMEILRSAELWRTWTIHELSSKSHGSPSLRRQPSKRKWTYLRTTGWPQPRPQRPWRSADNPTSRPAATPERPTARTQCIPPGSPLASVHPVSAASPAGRRRCLPWEQNNEEVGRAFSLCIGDHWGYPYVGRNQLLCCLSANHDDTKLKSDAQDIPFHTVNRSSTNVGEHIHVHIHLISTHNKLKIACMLFNEENGRSDRPRHVEQNV